MTELQRALETHDHDRLQKANEYLRGRIDALEERIDKLERKKRKYKRKYKELKGKVNSVSVPTDVTPARYQKLTADELIAEWRKDPSSIILNIELARRGMANAVAHLRGDDNS